MLHVVFTKLHNLVAEQLVNLNPHWDQKHLFEVSKYHMDYVRDGKIQGQCAFKKTKEQPGVSPSLT